MSENSHGRDPKGSGSHLSGEATDVSSSLRDIDPSRGPADQTCFDAAFAIEGVAQELEGIGRTASAKMLRNALDALLEVPAIPMLPQADADTERAVARAWSRYQAAVSPKGRVR